jgi:hypothetical protein
LKSDRRAPLESQSAVLAWPNQQVGLPFRSCVSMLVGMDNIELYDAAVDGRAEHRKEID